LALNADCATSAYKSLEGEVAEASRQPFDFVATDSNPFVVPKIEVFARTARMEGDHV